MIISQLSTRQHSARRLQCCFTSTETIREGDHRSLTSSFTQLLGSILPLECCFTSTETVGTIRDWSPGHLPLLSHNSGLGPVFSLQCCFTSTETIWEGDRRSLTSSFTQLLGSILPLECCFTSTETVGTVRDWSPGHLPLFSHNSGLGSVLPLQCCFTSTETVREGDPRSPTSSFAQLRPGLYPPT